MRISKPRILVVGLLSLFVSGTRAESPAGEPAAPTPPPASVINTAPAARLPAPPSVGPRSLIPPQPSLTPEENAILSQAHGELQKDPELQALNVQIKQLMEQRAKLAEEKLQKISPEAASILQKVKANQEKMQAERRAQIEALQAKRRAQQEKDASETSSHVADRAPASTPSAPAQTP